MTERRRWTISAVDSQSWFHVVAGPWPQHEDGESVEVMPVAEHERDIIDMAQKLAEAHGQRDRLHRLISEAERLLSPGMRAGTADAKAILRKALDA